MAVDGALQRLAATTLVPGAADEVLVELGSTPLRRPTTLLELLRRPELDARALARFDAAISDPAIAERVEVAVKYEGYLRRQEAEAERLSRLENVRLPEDLDYAALGALSREVREKLTATRPRSLGQAARISGVTPAAVSILATLVTASRRRAGQST
jgi:tRNA uridine 5-carboxymethylaminomethyl modification enzyme